MRMIFALILALLLGSVRLGTQTHQKPMKAGSEGEIKRVPMDSSTNSFSCGKYFLSSGVSVDRTRPGIVLFTFQDTATKDILVPMIGAEKLEVHLIPEQRAPTAKVIRAGGPVTPWIEIFISEEDFDQSPCLVHSKVIRS